MLNVAPTIINDNSERRYSSQMDLSEISLTRQKSSEKAPVLNYELEMRLLGSGINRKPLKQSTSFDDNQPRVNSQIQERIAARKKAKLAPKVSLAKWSSMSALGEKKEKRRTGLPSGFVFNPQTPASPSSPITQPFINQNREPKRKSMYQRFSSSRYNTNNSNNVDFTPYVISSNHHYYWPIKSLMHQDHVTCSILSEHQPETGLAVDIEGSVFIRPEFFVEQELVECLETDPELEIEQFYVYQVFGCCPSPAVTHLLALRVYRTVDSNCFYSGYSVTAVARETTLQITEQRKRTTW